MGTVSMLIDQLDRLMADPAIETREFLTDGDCPEAVDDAHITATLKDLHKATLALVAAIETAHDRKRADDDYAAYAARQTVKAEVAI